MKYQAIKQNKSGSRLLKMCNTLEEAKSVLRTKVSAYHGRSYIGGFPVYVDEKGKGYSIQGAHFFPNGQYVVCSIPEEELTAGGL